MVDNMTPEQRSETMSRIRSKNTRIELVLRKLLFARRLRYRLHAPLVPGRPDIVFPGKKVAVFVDGDFWHGWQFQRWKQKLAPQWRAKIERTRQRDRVANGALKGDGWIVVRLWEHQIKADPQACVERVIRALESRNHQPPLDSASEQ